MVEEGFERVALVDDLPEGMPFGVQLGNGLGICLIRVNGDVYAVADRCSHAEFPMSDGDMVDEYTIECGLHGARFDIRTGEVLELPATEGLPCYLAKVVNGEVWVRTSG